MVSWNRDEAAQADLVHHLVTNGVRLMALEVTTERMQDVYLAQVGLDRGNRHES